MQIHRMQASFGKLQGQSLELKDGLNIIEAPNETGKSTWCAFLLAMFYGINSRERDKTGFIAEKNRYPAWDIPNRIILTKISGFFAEKYEK